MKVCSLGDYVIKLCGWIDEGVPQMKCFIGDNDASCEVIET